MDLIYARNIGGNLTDIGVLQDYKFDLAYGKDENNFYLQVMAENNKCMADDVLYIEGTEYGGIIDGISSDTENGMVTYIGRTWHGILAGKVLCPNALYSRFFVSGNVSDCIMAVINHIGLAGLFDIGEMNYDIDINYSFWYQDAYSGIMEMLKENDLTANFVFKNGKVCPEIFYIQDYSQEDEFDNTQQGFIVGRTMNFVNHLVCIGNADLHSRYIIHLFADVNGGIVDYANVYPPIKDNDYILDTSRQILFGTNEIAQIYYDKNPQVRENYEQIKVKPYDWDVNVTNYYQYILNEDSGKYEYKNLETQTEENYVIVLAKPDNWDGHYSEYFHMDTAGEYISVEPEILVDYDCMTAYPEDWETNYGSYYTLAFNGVEYMATSVGGVSKDIYKLQTMPPSDWESNYNSYFYKKTYEKKLEYLAVKSKKKIVNGKEKEVAPEWKRKKFYTKYTKTVAPIWRPREYYAKVQRPFPPDFDNKIVYEYRKIETVPAFISGLYFQKVYDHYAVLVENGIKRLKELINQDELDIKLTMDNMYNINDIVGARDNVTGLFAQKDIVKKIVTIEKDMVNVEYEVNE